ncbi:MAG: alternative ribosome rescue aminoacyl-tRNA hydrolase ArfB, partial [Anaerolineales bacterium]
KNRRATKPTYGSRQRRLAGKSQRSEIKASRGKVGE